MEASRYGAGAGPESTPNGTPVPVVGVVLGMEASGYGARAGPESPLSGTPVSAGSLPPPLKSSPVLAGATPKALPVVAGVTPRGRPVLAGRAACNASSWPSSSLSWLLSFLQWDQMPLSCNDSTKVSSPNTNKITGCLGANSLWHACM